MPSFHSSFVTDQAEMIRGIAFFVILNSDLHQTIDIMPTLRILGEAARYASQTGAQILRTQIASRLAAAGAKRHFWPKSGKNSIRSTDHAK